MLSIVLGSLRVSHLVTLFHQVLMGYFKLENRLWCISNELRSILSFISEKNTLELFCLLKVIVLAWHRLVGNLFSLRQA